MKTRIVLLLAAVALGALAPSHGAEPSAGCVAGEVPSSTQNAGVGADVRGVPPSNPPKSADLVVCNTGKTVPTPAKGAVTVHVDVQISSVTVEVDGDSNNAAPSAMKQCTDGFARVTIDAKGPHFYQAPDGNFTDTDPKKKGNQPAKEQTAEQWANALKANCAG